MSAGGTQLGTAPSLLAQAVHWSIRLSLAALFAVTGYEKLLDPSAFAQAIANYQVVPESMVGVIALGLPVLELVAAAALLVPAYAQGAAVLCAGMLVTFAVAMAQSKVRGINLDCGCFGAALESQVSWSKVTLNSALAMLAGWTALVPLRNVPTPTTAPEAGP
jgi:putative oxidoreductase